MENSHLLQSMKECLQKYGFSSCNNNCSSQNDEEKECPEDSLGRIKVSFQPNECTTESGFCYSVHLTGEAQQLILNALESLASADKKFGENSEMIESRLPKANSASRGEVDFRRSRPSSITGSFGTVDGIDRPISNVDIDCNRQRCSRTFGSFGSVDSTNFQNGPIVHDAIEEGRSSGTKIEVLPEMDMFADDNAVMQAKEFDERVLSNLKSVDEYHLLLHRTRAVSSLASRLMGAPDENSCFEEVSRLLVPLFKADRASYSLMYDSEHFIIKKVAVTDSKLAEVMGSEGGEKGAIVPLKETAVEECARTLKQHYTPRTIDSPYPTHRRIHSIGINSVLVTPILVDGNKYAGAIVLCMKQEDAFREYDRILMNDIGAMVGANIYAKRMRRAAERSSKISREMLHAMIPPKVIEKIECFWDETSDEYKGRQKSVCSMTSTDDEGNTDKCRKDINEKINFINDMNQSVSFGGQKGIMVDTSAMDMPSTSSALYAKSVDNVCIIFTDIVGFSRMALEMIPIEVMNMLQSLFSRFDKLCDEHGVHKLETIGDAYICTTGLVDREDEDGSFDVRDSALRTLRVAKEMVREARKVKIPSRKGRKNNIASTQMLEIRVGINVGDLTCGVLGHRLPKFTVFGTAVNLAARMEQTSEPSKIRVSEAFHDLVSDAEMDWGEKEEIRVKNMGEVGSYLLDPVNEFDNYSHQ